MEKVPQYNEGLYTEYKKKYDQLISISDREIAYDIFEQIGKFGSQLRNKYGSGVVSRFALFHAMAGSTLPEEVNADDFQGEDSVAVFLDRLTEDYKEYLPKE